MDCKLKGEDDTMESVHSVVFKESESLEGKRMKIAGYDFNQGVNYTQLLDSLLYTGFQALNLGEAVNIVNEMIDWRLPDKVPMDSCDEQERDPNLRESVKCKVFLGFTSNLISSGVRDNIRYLVQHQMVDVVVTTTGGVEEDLSNVLHPLSKKILWTPSKLINRLGREINDETSYLYWAFKNDIPVFCPGLTDGSLEDMLYFHSFRNPGLVVDVVQDIRAMNGEAVHAVPRKTGMIILGGGLPKHHICYANMMKKGAEYAVFINTAQEFDGSDSGARPDEAVSWGKIRDSAKTVKVPCDATIAFPLLVARTFAKNKENARDESTIEKVDEVR